MLMGELHPAMCSSVTRMWNRIRPASCGGAGKAPIIATTEPRTLNVLCNTQRKTNTQIFMKTIQPPGLKWMLALCALQLAICGSLAQSSVLVNAFNTANEVTNNNGQAWQNWFGTAFY